MDSKVRWFRTEIPNMLDDADLSPHAYRLYGHIKRVAGDDGECNENTRHLAVKCQMSIGQISKAKRELFERGFIHLGRGDFGRDVMKPSNIWQQNYETYASSPEEQSCSQYEQEQKTCSDSEQDVKTRSPDEQEVETCSQYEHIENITTPNPTDLVAMQRTEPLATKFRTLADELKATKNRAAKLLEIYVLLYGKETAPQHGYILKVANLIGGAGYMAQRLWELSARPPNGDILAYLQAEHKAKGQRKSYTNGASASVGWQKAFDAQDIPDYIRDMQNGGGR